MYNIDMDILINDDFSPEMIFECGQCFRWNRQPDGSYVGIAGDRAARIRREGEGYSITGGFDPFWRRYFDLDRDYAAVRRAVSVDPYMRRAAEFGCGIRILRQDKWETLCSFIISQCNNIARIKSIISRLCEAYGDEIEFEGRVFHAFPSAEKIACLEPRDLHFLRAGYRAPYIISAARRIAGGYDLDRLTDLTREEALESLRSFEGVGDKVASCVMLFSLGFLDAFPRDVWVNRVLTEHYSGSFDPSVFGGYAGIAQQYMFYYARSGGGTAGGRNVKRI
jgi:N-glycosylase/DNA lyase